MTEPAASESKKKPRKTVTRSTADGSAAPSVSGEAKWKATPEAKRSAIGLRIGAGVLWLVAIALQAFAIFGLLNTPARSAIADQFDWDSGVSQGADGAPVVAFPTWAFWSIIVILVINAVLCIIAGYLWKRANRLDPASKDEKFKFFVQNQLGAIIPILAFLPLIILIFLNKDMDAKQKGWAGGVGIVVAIAAVALGVDFNPPSVEQYTAEQNWDRERVIAITGADEVYWVQTGAVYHLCAEVSPLENASGEEILVGTVAQATAETSGGMERLTKQVQMEITQCNAAGHDFTLPDPSFLDSTPPASVLDDVVGTTEETDEVDGETEQTPAP
jgi:hypothetical protein